MIKQKLFQYLSDEFNILALDADLDEIIRICTPAADEIIAELNNMIEESEKNAKTFEEHNMVASELTSIAMSQAYKNVLKLVNPEPAEEPECCGRKYEEQNVIDNEMFRKIMSGEIKIEDDYEDTEF